MDCGSDCVPTSRREHCCTQVSSVLHHQRVHKSTGGPSANVQTKMRVSSAAVETKQSESSSMVLSVRCSPSS